MATEQGTPLAQILSKKLDDSLVAYRTSARGTVAYLKTATVIRQANDIFGYGKWKTELLSPPTKVGNGYMAVMRVTVKNSEIETSYEDVGYCPSRREGDENTAIKGAVSDALKRCLRHFGAQFGNNLYFDDDEQERFENTEDDFDSQLHNEPEEILSSLRISPTDGTSQAKWEITLDNGDVLPYYGDIVPVEEGDLAKVIIVRSKKGNRYIKEISPVRTKSSGDGNIHPRIKNQMVRIAQHSFGQNESDILELCNELSAVMFGFPCDAIQKEQDVSAFVKVLAQCKDERTLINAIEERHSKRKV